jgi:hypothetical protein
VEREAAIAALVSLKQVEHINVASLKPTDVIVVELSEAIPTESAEYIRRTLREIFPSNRVIICDQGTRLKVVNGADAEESTEGAVV